MKESHRAPLQAIAPADDKQYRSKSEEKRAFRINAKDACNRDLVTRQVRKAFCGFPCETITEKSRSSVAYFFRIHVRQFLIHFRECYWFSLML